MKLGFLGTGKITSSIIEGLLKSKTKFNQIIISKEMKIQIFKKQIKEN